MIDLQVKADVMSATALLDDMAQRQIPFGTARALTWTAQDAQKAIKSQIPGRFNLRTKWIVGGIRIKPAKKNYLAAVVYSRDPFMQYQEDGGSKARGNGRMVIPQPSAPRWMKSARNKIAGRPNIIKKGGGLFQKVGKRKLKYLAALSHVVRVAPRFGFKLTAGRVARITFQSNFITSMRQALRTARK